MTTNHTPGTYDYEAAVFWNAHAGALWRRFAIHLSREVAKRRGRLVVDR